MICNRELFRSYQSPPPVEQGDWPKRIVLGTLKGIGIGILIPLWIVGMAISLPIWSGISLCQSAKYQDWDDVLIQLFLICVWAGDVTVIANWALN